MSNLTDDTIREWIDLAERQPPTISLTLTLDALHAALIELQRHRATIKRLEEMALSLEHSWTPDIRKVGTELRNRLKGP